jgi:hypothetical protein
VTAAPIALAGAVPSIDERARQTVDALVAMVHDDEPLDEQFKTIIRTTSLRRDVVDVAVRLCENGAAGHDREVLRRVRSVLVLARRSLLRQVSPN